jgi:pyruvate formate lyase activating enzyme
MKTMEIFEKLDSLWRKELTRRDFIKGCVVAGISAGAAAYHFDVFSKYKAFAAIGEKRGMREALFYEKIGDSVQCQLCFNRCTLADGERGFCRVREPVGGKLYTLVYELICSAHIDPIEKKPMFHMLPGSRSFSIATAGCNSRCKYCQNWTISQKSPEETTNNVLSVKNLVASAISNGCNSISYTYTEPIVFYEYSLAAAELAKRSGIRNIWVTGGKINPEPLINACRVIDAANVDFKAFNDNFLREVCAQRLDNITETIKIMKAEGVWVELTNLIIPTLNDDMDDIKRMASWISKNAGPDVPLHFSRFWPQYKLRSLYPTPVDTLKRARDIAVGEGLNYVYIGNVPELDSSNTVCPGCGKTVVKRAGYRVAENNVSSEGKCVFCNYKIAGIWK